MKRLATAVGVACLAFSMAAPAFAQGGGGKNLNSKESTLLKRAEKEELRSLAMSSDFNHAAWVIKRGEKQLVVMDNKDMGEWDWIVPSSLGFSPDGKHIVYVVQKDNKMFMMTDDKKQKEYASIKQGTTMFSPDSAHLVYAAQTDDRKWHLVVDDKEGPAYDDVLGGMFSEDGRHFAYAAVNGKKVVILDDKEGPSFDDIGSNSLMFGPDGRLAYVATRGSKWMVVLDNVAGKEYDGIMANSLRFTTDGKHVTYAARREFDAPVGDPKTKVAKWIVVDVGAEKTVEGSEEWDDMAQGPTYSPDSKRLAYVGRQTVEVPATNPTDKATKELRFFAAVSPEASKKPEKSQPYELILPPFISFSPDSAHYLYFAAKKGDVVKTNRFFAVMDGSPHADYDGVRAIGPVFSPDSKHTVYIAQKLVAGADRILVVYDGKEYVTDYQAVPAGVFGPDGGRFAYLGVTGDKRLQVTLDGVPGKLYVGASVPTFGPQGKHVVYSAQRDNKKNIVVVDGNTETAEYDGMPQNSKFIFDAPDKFHFLALRGEEVIRVEVEISDK